MTQEWNNALPLLGGLALFLYGMDSLSRAVQQGAGKKLRWLLARCTANPLAGLLTGTVVTAVLQSSSAVTVMVMAFLAAGLLQLRQAVPVVFGANIGTTITAQLLAFRAEESRWLLLAVGVVLCFFCKGLRGRCLGEAVFSLGLLFGGIAAMNTALQPLLHSPFLAQWISGARETPWQGFAAGLCMTLMVQSSSAVIALLQNIAGQPGPDGVHSLLGLAGAIPVLLGANVGTTITAVLAAIGQGRDARRLATAHAVFNLTGAAVCLALLTPFVQLVQQLLPAGPECVVLARQIANAHTLFNVCCALVWLPLTDRMVWLVQALFPENSRENPTKVGE